MSMPVKVKCKQCTREAKSDEFILDPVYKMMVCKECVKDRKLKEMTAKKAALQTEQKKVQEEQKKTMPPGWDAEDAELERSYNKKQSEQTPIQRIDDDKLKYTCKKCKYSFTYSISARRPGRCPYCSTAVQV